MSGVERDFKQLSTRFERFVLECREHGSALYERLSAHVASSDALLQMAAEAPQEPIPNLFFGAVHRALLGDHSDPLAAYYKSLTPTPREDDELEAHFDAFCTKYSDRIVATIRSNTVQTNEARRCACLLPAFQRVFAAGDERPMALVELGASAGLLLAFDHYRYRYNDIHEFGPESGVVLDCELEGDAQHVDPSMPVMSRRIAMDLNPIDPADADARAWLEALVWPEHDERRERLRAALLVAAEVPMERVAGDALDRLIDVLAAVPMDETLCFFHSSTINQFTAAQRDRLEECLQTISAWRIIHEICATGLQIHHRVHDDGSVVSTHVADYSSHGSWLKLVDSVA